MGAVLDAFGARVGPPSGLSWTPSGRFGSPVGPLIGASRVSFGLLYGIAFETHTSDSKM